MDHRKDPDTIPAQVSMRFGAQDEKNMSLALSQALLALKEGEIPVGCALIGADGSVLSLTHNQTQKTGDLSAHAEMLAIRAVPRYQLQDAVMYVTLEPCPMCAGAIALSGIKRVIYAASDKKYGCCGSVYRLTEDPAFDRYCRADGGLLANKSERLLNSCFQSMRK